MPIAREIKLNRLLWAVGPPRFLMADTVPHPSLSPGVVESVIRSFFAHQPAAALPKLTSQFK